MRAWNAPTQLEFADAFLTHAPGTCPVAPLGPENIAMAIITTNSSACAAVRDPGSPNPVGDATSSNANGNAAAGGVAAGGRAPSKVANGVQGRHAEMVLHDAFPPSSMRYVGVSKQCCLLCDLAYRFAGVARRGCHGVLLWPNGYQPVYDHPDGPGPALLGQT
jgi:hypothetical protein